MDFAQLCAPYFASMMAGWAVGASLVWALRLIRAAGED